MTSWLKNGGFQMAISTDNVVFDREPLKVDRLWAVVATHPSGQQEHIVGFQTAAEASEIADPETLRMVDGRRCGRGSHPRQSTDACQRDTVLPILALMQQA
jgi:hypothetical protein